MKAMIFAAGIGSRLKPYTIHKPKALVEVGGKPILEWIIQKLINTGINQIIINIHHFGEQIIEYLNEKKHFGINIEISDERTLLQDTGGGLKKAAWYLEGDDPFLLHNVDILSVINLEELIHFHKKTNPLATLAIKKRPGSRFLLVNKKNQLCGWENIKTGEKIISRPCDDLVRTAFSGIHVVSPAIFPLIKEEGIFSITELYLRLAADQRLLGFDHSQDYWNDLGTPETLFQAESAIKTIGPEKFL